MSTTATRRIPPAALVEVLAHDKVLAAGRRLIDAKLRRESALRLPDNDSAAPETGQPRANAVYKARRDADMALIDLADAVDAAAEKFVSQQEAK
jgi:hypothetical protein